MISMTTISNQPMGNSPYLFIRNPDRDHLPESLVIDTRNNQVYDLTSGNYWGTWDPKDSAIIKNDEDNSSKRLDMVEVLQSMDSFNHSISQIGGGPSDDPEGEPIATQVVQQPEDEGEEQQDEQPEDEGEQQPGDEGEQQQDEQLEQQGEQPRDDGEQIEQQLDEQPGDEGEQLEQQGEQPRDDGEQIEQQLDEQPGDEGEQLEQLGEQPGDEGEQLEEQGEQLEEQDEIGRAH